MRENEREVYQAFRVTAEKVEVKMKIELHARFWVGS